MKNIEEINIKKIKSPGGSLSFFQIGEEIEFEIKRIYYIYEFCKENRRGFHGHKNLKQVMWCPHGKIEIEFDNGKEKEIFILDNPTKILVVREGYWREFISLEENSILCVGASDIYDEDDYIRDYKKYIKWMGEKYEKKNTI